jgi:hypothetical protein
VKSVDISSPLHSVTDVTPFLPVWITNESKQDSVSYDDSATTEVYNSHEFVPTKFVEIVFIHQSLVFEHLDYNMAGTLKHLKTRLDCVLNFRLNCHRHLDNFPSYQNNLKHRYFRTIAAPNNNTMADSRSQIFTHKAPNPLPAINSQAIVANGIVYCSGNVAINAETNKIIDGDIQLHTVNPPDCAFGSISTDVRLAPMYTKPFSNT